MGSAGLAGVGKGPAWSEGVRQRVRHGLAGSGGVWQGGSGEVGMGRHGSARVDRSWVRRGRAGSEGVGQGRSAGAGKGLQGLVRVDRGWQGSGE